MAWIVLLAATLLLPLLRCSDRATTADAGAGGVGDSGDCTPTQAAEDCVGG